MAPTKLAYMKYGDPLVELSLVEEKLPGTLKPNEALIRGIYAPINPADLYTVRGLYPLRPPIPAVGGMEGVFEVIKGHSFEPGDRVITLPPGFGSWRQETIVDEGLLIPIPKTLSAEAAATVVINPLTAYFMLKDIVPLKAGEVLIQNAANSAVGQLVIQLAKICGIKTINVIRHRENLQETIDYLKGLGADAVITNEQLYKELGQLKLDLPAPTLALECVGGHMAAELAATLPNGGTLAVYGMLSGQPCHVSQADLIFRNIHVVGYWLTNSLEIHKRGAIDQVLKEIIGLHTSGKLLPPKSRKFALENWQDAINHATRGFTNEKALLHLN